MTYTPPRSKLHSAVDKITYTDQTATVEREYSNLYLVDELAFPLSDRRNTKQVMAWGRACADVVSEYITVTECLSKSIARQHEEKVRATEMTAKGLQKIKAERLTVKDKKWWDIQMEIREPIKIAELAVKHVAHEFTEGAVLKELYEKRGEKVIIEPLLVRELFSRRWTIGRVYNESFNVTDKTIKEVCGYKHESISIKDRRMSAATNGVLSNILFSEGEELYEDFQRTVDKVAGYTPFIEFRVGDYEYKNAIYRMLVTRKNLNANSLIYDYAVHVDIPDTFDRGDAVVSGETKIYFNKHYYNAPEVNVTVTGGNEILIPRILTLNGEDEAGRYFSVILENSTGESKTGRISWSARGY